MEFKAGGGRGGIAKENRLSLRDGESVTGVFAGDPYDFRQHWFDGQGSVLCTGDACPECKGGGKKPGFRFRINFVTQDNGALVAKVWEQGWRVYSDLKEIHGTDYDLQRTRVKITRRGSGKNDTSYSVLPIPGGLLTEDQYRQIKNVKLHNLQNDGATNHKLTAEESDIPF